MTKLAKKIIASIEKTQITPRPRWHFLLKNILLWGLAFVAIVLASLALGTFISDFLRADWSLTPRFPGGVLHFSFLLLGWFFFLLLLLGVAAAFIFLRATRRGYRYGTLALFALVFGTALVLSLSLLPTALPAQMRALHDRSLPPAMHAGELHAPLSGRLLGELSADELGDFYLTAITGEVYELLFFAPPPELSNGLMLVFGELVDDDVFAVLQLRPVPPFFKMKELPPTLRITR